jgi:hypothetical protein
MSTEKTPVKAVNAGGSVAAAAPGPAFANVNPDDLKPKEKITEKEGDAANAYFSEWTTRLLAGLALPSLSVRIPDDNPVLVNALQYLRDRYVPEGKRVTESVGYPGGTYYNDYFEWAATYDGIPLMQPHRAGVMLLASNPAVVYGELKTLGVVDPAFTR